jgi:GTP cyclohydrolase-4
MIFNESFYDVPNQNPSIKIHLDRVSVYNQRILISFYDDLCEHVSTLFNIKAGSALETNQRGIHMSRIEQAFQELSITSSLSDVALHIARNIYLTQRQKTAEVHLKGENVLKRVTEITRLVSYDPITIMAHAIAGEKEEVGLGIGASIITACPCMQTYALDEMTQILGLTVREPEALMKSIPIATHSQKGYVVTYISGPPDAMRNLNLKHIYKIVEQATVLTWELLKRPDEYDLVRKAHLKAQFVEDVVRSTLSNACIALDGFDNSLSISVNAKSYESIHGHDIEAETQIQLGQLRSMLGSTY